MDRRSALAIAAALLAGGCAVSSLPDGRHIERLSPEELARSSAPPVSPEETARLRQLDAQILAQQEEAARAQQWLDAQQSARLQWELEYGSYWPARPWFWDGPRWRRGDRWGVDLWGTWPY
jgi:hypothetical protein